MTYRHLRIGLIVEGPTDSLVLQALMRSCLPGWELSFVPMQPDEVAAGPHGNGWKGVRGYCQEVGGQLQALMRVVSSDPLDLLVIHVDGDIAKADLGITLPCPPVRPLADALRQVMMDDWLRCTALPSFVLLATPMMATETWVVAALAEADFGLAEDDGHIWRWLTSNGHLRLKDGKPKKSQLAYRPLAEAVGRELVKVRLLCSEAERFCAELESFASAHQ